LQICHHFCGQEEEAQEEEEEEEEKPQINEIIRSYP
jgi:hypothetical protein